MFCFFLPEIAMAQINWDVRANEYIAESIQLEREGDLEGACDYMKTAHNIAIKTNFEVIKTQAIEKRKTTVCSSFEKKSLEKFTKNINLMGEVLKCYGYPEARNACSYAGNYDKCMEIKFGKSYFQLKKYCE